MSDSKPAGSAYESQARVATYLEMEWSDWLLFSSTAAVQQSAKPPAGPVIPRFYSNVVQFAARNVAFQQDLIRICDVGAATGRLIFEWLHQFPNTAEAVLVEPSDAFNRWSRSLLLGSGPLEPIPTVRFHENPGSAKALRRPDEIASFSKAKVDIHSGCLPSLPRPNAYFDIITCLNVADRVAEPRKLVSDLQWFLKPEGVLILASPMDWRHNDYTPQEEWFEDLRLLLLKDAWHIFDGADIEYACRLSSRQVISYLCQVVAARKLTA
jgi:2-polyprenyl-3-methyl-5-hydroxy-6-metoxy-1,4-benzoquinol methylase